jgi:hypothetical protein
LGFVRKFKAVKGIIPDRLRKLIEEVEASDSCLYAINISMLIESAKDQYGGILYVTQSVPVSAILGKIIIPRDTEVTQIKCTSLGDIYSRMRSMKDDEFTA